MSAAAALFFFWKNSQQQCLWMLCICLLFNNKAQAQFPKTLPPTQSTATAPVAQAPGQNQLSPMQMEEALRLLLRADSIASQQHGARRGPESSGLIVDQTITKIGHDFYDQFYSQWEAPADNDDFTIIISEKPSRSNNNAIMTVVVNAEELLEFPLQGKFDIIEETNQQVMDAVSSFLQQAQNLSKQLEKGNRQPLEKY